MADAGAAEHPMEAVLLQYVRLTNTAVDLEVLKRYHQDNTPVGAPKHPEFMELINMMLSKGKLSVSRDSAGKVFVKVASDKDRVIITLQPEEALVYQIIDEAGNKGIWSRDVRHKSSLEQKTLNKILKTLEGRKLIKSVTSVVATKKKMYMKYELTPDQSLTGGAFFSEREFDGEFTQTMYNMAYKFIESRSKAAEELPLGPYDRMEHSYVNAKQVQEHIRASRVSNEDLGDQDIRRLLNTLVYSNKITKRMLGGVELYKLAKIPESHSAVLATPCGVCPVADNCAEGGVISPTNCIYISNW
eukprot:m.71120 g.71120  ORF g.71120 m.71120 type:complete len:302 (+) comp14346_c0_seq1:1631-2536(+)